MNNNIINIASRIIALDFYGARDAGETPETIAETITAEPLTVINCLLDYIEQSQEG